MKFYANIRSKYTFVQMVLNNRKSIFEISREKNATYEKNLKNRILGKDRVPRGTIDERGSPNNISGN